MSPPWFSADGLAQGSPWAPQMLWGQAGWARRGGPGHGPRWVRSEGQRAPGGGPGPGGGSSLRGPVPGTPCPGVKWGFSQLRPWLSPPGKAAPPSQSLPLRVRPPGRRPWGPSDLQLSRPPSLALSLSTPNALVLPSLSVPKTHESVLPRKFWRLLPTILDQPPGSAGYVQNRNVRNIKTCQEQ